MRDSGHALAAVLGQRLVRVEVTSDDEGVGPPGVKAEVIFVNVERQLAKEVSVLSAAKNVLQG